MWGGDIPLIGTFISYIRHGYSSSEIHEKYLFKGVGEVNAIDTDMG